jgi:hypothetical protein
MSYSHLRMGRGGGMGASSIDEFGYRKLKKSYHMTFVNNNELRTLHMSYEIHATIL